MPAPDLNLLIALDALLAEGSVTAAAKRLNLSVSAMSRSLTRLRAATNDPLLVQAGRSLVLTPHATQILDRVRSLTREAQEVLAPAQDELNLDKLNCTFTIRANEGFVALFASALVARIGESAPLVRLRFAPKPNKEAAALRDGTVDVEIGTAGSSASEMRGQLLFRDHFVGAVRQDHPLLGEPVTPQRYAAFRHVVASRRGAWTGPVDNALLGLGLQREIAAVVPGFLDALSIARCSDLVAQVPNSCLQDSEIGRSLVGFELPVATSRLAISIMWHPRLDADPGHRWLRQIIVETCRSSAAS